MRNAPEVVREVGVHDFRMATEQQLLHLYSGLLGVAPSAVGVDFRRKTLGRNACHADTGPTMPLSSLVQPVFVFAKHVGDVASSSSASFHAWSCGTLQNLTLPRRSRKGQSLPN